MRYLPTIIAVLLAFAFFLAACAPRTVNKPQRPGYVTPPTEDVEPEEEGEPDEADAPLEVVPLDTTRTDSTRTDSLRIG